MFFPFLLGVLNASFSYVFLRKISYFFYLILLQLFSFRIIPGPPRLAIAVCGARTLVKIFFRKFIIKSWSLERSNTRGIDFWISELRELDSLKHKWKFPYICPAVGQTERIVTSSVAWMYVTGKTCFCPYRFFVKILSLIISSNFTVRKFTKKRFGILLVEYSNNPFLRSNQTFKIDWWVESPTLAQ